MSSPARRDRGDVALVYLEGPQALIPGRLTARTSHFMPVGLLDSQFGALQEPALIVSEIVRRLAERSSG